MTNNKSVILAYVFALFGGLFGLHHLYLGRTQHALVWCTTFGGFGLGFFYEFFALVRNYVREANEDPLVVHRYRFRMRQRKSPSFELFRFCGQFLTSVFYGFITYYAFPDTWHRDPLLSLCIASCSILAIAAGTQMVGTLGPRRCSFIWPLFGALLGMPFIIWRKEVSPSFNAAAFLSSLVFEWKIEWDPAYFSNSSVMEPKETPPSTSPKRKRRHFIQRCLIFAFGMMIFGTIFTSALYQNLQVDIKGRRVKVKDVLADFFKSQEFVLLCQQLMNVLRQLWTFYLRHGLKGIWTQIWMALDSENEKQAYESIRECLSIIRTTITNEQRAEVLTIYFYIELIITALNLRYDASQKEIESQCRTLSRQWHPDRHRDPLQKQKAQSLFMNIQQACDRLSHERKRRQLLNTQKRENPH